MRKKSFLMLILSVVMLCTVTGCSKDDDDRGGDFAGQISGRYAGQLISGGNVVAERCFVEIVRYSDNDVKLTLESDNHNPGAVILNVAQITGGYELTSETYASRATIKGKALNFYYSAGNYSYTFTGEKQ